MQIHFSQSGGYANRRLTYTADTTTLPPDLAQELSTLVTTSGLWDMPPPDPAPPLPDLITYTVTLQDGDRQLTRSLTDMTVPDTLRPLLTRLAELAVG
jgi:hypothetical protein